MLRGGHLVFGPLPVRYLYIAPGRHSLNRSVAAIMVVTHATPSSHSTLIQTVDCRLIKCHMSLSNLSIFPLKAEFTTYRDSGKVPQLLAQELAGRTPVAVCTAWPYVIIKSAKTRANQAMVYEFLRYYSNLGFWLMVYDNNGDNLNGVLDSGYARAHPQRGRFSGAIEKYLIYHNYTIGSLLSAQSGPKLP